MAPESPISADPESRITGKNTSAAKVDQESYSAADDHDLAGYRQRYGLSADPFAEDQHFPLFTGAQRREVLEQLLHLCQFGHSVLVVLGDSGVGKTRMAYALLDAMGDADEVCLIDAKPAQSVEGLLAQVAHTFGLRRSGSESAGQLLAALRSFSQPIMGSNDLALVVIDNAHNLTDQTLAALLSLLQGRDGDNRRLHLAFFAESSLISRLDQLDMQDVLINDFYLESFTLHETVDYLNFRMEMSDYLGPEIFNESLVDPWWRQAHGKLPIVHDYARDHLLGSVLPPFNSARKPFPVLHIVAAAVLGAVFLMTFFYGSGEEELQAEKVDGVISESIPINPIPPSDDAGKIASTIISPSPVDAPGVPPEAVSEEESTDPVISPDTQSFIAEPATQNQPVSTSVAMVSDATPSPLVKEVVVKEAVEPAPEPLISVPETSVPVENPKPVAPSVAMQQKHPLSEDEQTLMSWQPTEFTLQLLGVSTEKAARDFMSAQSNRADLLMFKSLRKGKDWFVVVAGRYSSAAAARQSIANLPANQQKAGPWPRELKVIQEEMER